MLPSEKDDGNIEYKRYIMININKNKYDYSDYELKELIPLLKKNIYNKNEEDVTIEDIDNFHFRLIHAAIKMVEKTLFRHDAALTQAQQFQHLIFFRGQIHPCVANAHIAGR